MLRHYIVAGLASVGLLACGSTMSPQPDARVDTDAATDVAADSAPADLGGEAAPDAREAGYGDGASCLPGLPRCHGDFGYQVCEQDGTWSESHSCAGYSSNGTTSYCAEIPMDGGGAWATCVDPACWYWLGRHALGGATQVGICEPDGSFQACGPGGTLAPAACAGACTTVATLDGRAVGSCAPACEEGARECVGGPFSRVCAQGRWAEAPPCDGACNPVATGPLPDVRCGGACDPGTSRCRADGGAVEICTAGRVWTVDRTCLLGRCRPAGPQAECESECTPGTRACAFDGATTERVCGAMGLWLAETACATGTTCRLGDDRALGCVPCVGSGNAFGFADARCGLTGVAACGADNRWLAEVTCAAGEACTSVSRGVSTLASCQAP